MTCGSTPRSTTTFSTRPCDPYAPELSLGVSTRGAITYYRAVQSLALTAGRDYVIPDDVKRLAVPVLAHRVQCGGLVREGQRQRAKAIIEQIAAGTPVRM